MLYNKDLKKIRTNTMCLDCENFDKSTKKCNGLGKTCYGYDPLTRTIFDPMTKMPLKKD